MNWKLIKKDKAKQPAKGNYTDWKEIIAKECDYQCIYCTVSEQQFGGIDHFHIEHYKPKSIDRFKVLINDITNLFYSCPVCNRFKSDDWPCDTIDLSTVCYPNPSNINYGDIFTVDVHTYNLIGKYVCSNYMVNKLYLNRPQLIYERREFFLRQRELHLKKEINSLRKEQIVENDATLLGRILDVFEQLQETEKKRLTIRPYKLAEIRREK